MADLHDTDFASALAALDGKVQAVAVALASLVESAPRQRAPTIWSYDARFPADVENLYEAEYWDNSVKRWVGPKPTLEFRPSLLGGRSYRVVCNIVDFIDEEAAASFAIFANGVKLPLQPQGRGQFATVFAAECDGEQVMLLSTSGAKSPHELRGSEDRRHLAFSLANIFIVEVSRNAQ